MVVSRVQAMPEGAMQQRSQVAQSCPSVQLAAGRLPCFAGFLPPKAPLRSHRTFRASGVSAAAASSAVAPSAGSCLFAGSRTQPRHDPARFPFTPVFA